MVLVVNKMERETDGNTLTSQKIKRDDLAKVLVPYIPEQLNICFLDAESYLAGIKESNNDPEYSEELIQLSGYTQFISILNNFVEKHGIAGKLTTLLYQIDERIQEALKVLEPNSDDDIRALNDCSMNDREALFKVKRVRGNTYYIMQGEKYLQFLGITSNSRIVVEEDLNNRCRWCLVKVDDVDAFLIVPVSTNRLISRFAAVDVPNGAAVDNLPLWIFLNNSTRSQMFKFHKVL